MRSSQGFLQKLIATLGLGFSLGLMATAQASPAAPVNGADYRTLEKVQSTDAGKKVEVTEFFWYSCPHCSAFESQLADWVKKQGDNIVFKRVHVGFRESFQPQQRLYYSLEAMGKVDEMQKKIFNAIHVERKTLDTDAAITDFVVAQGIDRKKFTDVYTSFGVQSKVRRSVQLQEAYKIDGVPMIAIDGRYMTSPSIVGASIGNQPELALQSAALQVMDFLVAKSAKEHKASAAVTPAAAVATTAKTATPAAIATHQVAANGKK